MLDFLQKRINSVGVPTENTSIKVYIYSNENQNGLLRFNGKKHTLFFVSTLRYFIEDAIFMRDLSTVCCTIDNLPEGFCDVIAIDCLEDFEGNLINVYQACVKKGFNLLLVTGISQFDNFFKYNAFLKSLENVEKIDG